MSQKNTKRPPRMYLKDLIWDGVKSAFRPLRFALVWFMKFRLVVGMLALLLHIFPALANQNYLLPYALTGGGLVGLGILVFGLSLVWSYLKTDEFFRHARNRYNKPIADGETGLFGTCTKVFWWVAGPMIAIAVIDGILVYNGIFTRDPLWLEWLRGSARLSGALVEGLWWPVVQILLLIMGLGICFSTIKHLFFTGRFRPWEAKPAPAAPKKEKRRFKLVVPTDD